MSTRGERMIELAALWRLEQVEVRWRARWAALVAWLGDRRHAVRQARSVAKRQYVTVLRNREEKRESATPEAKRRHDLTRAQEREVSARERLLRVDEQYRGRMWALGWGAWTAPVGWGGLGVLLAGWASFAWYAVPNRLAVGPALGVPWLLVPVVVFMAAMSWAVRTRREARIARGRLDSRSDLMTEYDKAWVELADAEHTAGTRGAAMVVAPRLWADHARSWVDYRPTVKLVGAASPQAGQSDMYRPSTELLDVPFPWAIDHSARLLAEGDSRTVDEMERRAGLRSGPVPSKPYGMWNGGEGDTVYHR